MKLFARYNRINIGATILVLLVGGFCYYFILRSTLIHELDKDLKIEEQEVADFVKLNHKLPSPAEYKGQRVLFKEGPVMRRTVESVDMYDSIENETLPARQLAFSINSEGKNYNVSIIKSRQETEDLVQLIVMFTLAIVVLLLLMLFIINRFLLNKLWLPFYNVLGELKQFNVNNKKPVPQKTLAIDEFNQLNAAVTEMSNSVLKDYEALKSFTENASHEIQTPLAVIQSKLELLMQSENFTEQQMQYVQQIQGEASRLSKLNQSLLLLTKIDNQQFSNTEKVNLSAIITKQLANYEELIAAKGITLTKNIEPDCLVLMNEAMAEVLITNLITNSIRHNLTNGTIQVDLNPTALTISNTGPPLNSDPNEMFERFKKDGVNAESLGLGLSIVKKITEQYDFRAQYNYANTVHRIVISFNGSDHN